MSIFSKTPNTRVGSNTFDLTHDVKMSTKFGLLTPCCVIDCLPGDRFNISASALVRLAPLLAPVMHRANIYIHYFFVPNRLLWDNWENFITGGRDGLDTSVHPYVDYVPVQAAVGSLFDYLGLPTVVDSAADTSMKINPMPFAAYQKIWADYFRDRNFVADPEGWRLTDGDNDLLNLTPVRRRCWRHDYLTSALPWTQRGPEVLLPLGTEADIVTKEDSFGEIFQFVRYAADPHDIIASNTDLHDNGTGRVSVNAGATTAYVTVEDSHKVDLSTATAASIIDLRRAVRLQEWLEKSAVGGSRYIEQNQIHFGVRSSDARLQRSEYIGGFASPMKISEVLQTSGTFSGGETPQGNMAGHGVSIGGSKTYSYFCEEHGYIIGVFSCLPDTAYQQGVPRHFFRQDRFDYAFPTFAHIGEQPVYAGEVWLNDGGGSLDTAARATWGYIPRYAEYKFCQNRVAGDFRSTLDFWHMGRKFAALPPLNNNFTEMDYQEVDRIFAVEDDSDFLWCQVLNSVKVSRKLSVFGTPYL